MGKDLNAFIRVFRMLPQFLAPLAKGQQAIVMALCPSCVRPSVSLSVHACVRASVNSCFKKLLRNY